MIPNGVEQTAENWTKRPNCILDNLDKYTPVECKVLMLIVRKNLGYSEPNYAFSVNYTCKKTGHKKTAILKAIDGLLGKKSIKVLDTGSRGVRLFEVNWADPGLVLKSDRSQKETGHKKKPVLVLKRDQSPYRKKTEKENNNSKAKSKQPSSSFSFLESKPDPKPQVDIDALLNLFPENLQQPVLENIVTKGVHEHSQDYVQESILLRPG